MKWTHASNRLLRTVFIKQLMLLAAAIGELLNHSRAHVTGCKCKVTLLFGRHSLIHALLYCHALLFVFTLLVFWARDLKVELIEMRSLETCTELYIVYCKFDNIQTIKK